MCVLHSAMELLLGVAVLNCSKFLFFALALLCVANALALHVSAFHVCLLILPYKLHPHANYLWDRKPNLTTALCLDELLETTETRNLFK